MTDASAAGDLVATVARLQEENRQLELRFAERASELTFANQQLQRTIAESNQRALALQRVGLQRTRFFAGLAHEMRTPLNAVMGLADLLTDMEMGDEARHTSRLIRSSSRALVRLINDLLDHSRLEAGQLELVREPYNLRDMIGELADITAVQCEDLGLSFALQVDAELPDPIAGDGGRLRQVLLNLLGNALKFTPEGRVRLEVRVLPSASEHVEAEFRVTDTGIGIAPEQQTRLFEPYSQTAAGVAAGSGSTGLGLAISRMLVERMGGRIGFESAEGRGSSFWFVLPLEPALGDAVGTPETAAAQVPLTGRTALVVEDNRINQRVAVGMLKRLGIAARTADDGRDALTILTGTRFDLVFMDVHLSGLDGLETTRRLRSGMAGELNRQVPVIAMTGDDSPEDRRRCIDAGMNDHVAKPIGGEQLEEAIARTMASTATADGAQPDVAFDLGVLAAQMDGDRDLAGEIYTLFLEDTRRRLTRMTAAAQRHELDAVVTEAGSVEGAALNVQASSLARLAAAIADAARQGRIEQAQASIAELAGVTDDLAANWRQTIG